jgi:thioredoxin reductase (NADPH)
MSESEDDEQFYRDTESVAFRKISDHQLALLEPLGARRTAHRGDMIFRAGQRDVGLSVVLRGEAEVFEKREGVEQILATAGERDFIGDVAMLQGTSALASARVKSDEAELLEVPAEKLRRALAELPGLGEPIVNAFIMRRERLQRDQEFAGLRILSPVEDHEGRRLHDFLTKNHVPHRFVGAESEAGRELAARYRLSTRDLPALLTPSGARLPKPSLREVAQVAGLLRPLAQGDEMEIQTDLVIVGAGPAGLAAAVYAASEGLKTIVLESYAPGGQAGSSSLIENFFGFPTGISGGVLTYRAQLQAYRFGAKFSTPAQALTLEFREGKYPNCLQVEGCPASLHSRAVLISTGADYRRLDAEGREEFEGAGVYYAATAFEGQLCQGATVVVAGAGNSAGQAAMFLSEGAAKVILVVRGNDLRKSMSDYLSRRVLAAGNIEVLYETEIRNMRGGKFLEGVELENTATKARRAVETPALFSMIGATPCTSWLPPEIARDEKGFIRTGAAVAKEPPWQKSGRAPGPLETSVPGVFAAGDVRSGSVKRCAAAVGEGGMALAGVQEWLSDRP